MAKAIFNRVLNLPSAVEKSKAALDYYFDEFTIKGGEIFHVFIYPYQAEKTHKQLAAIRVLCNQLAEKVDGEYGYYTADRWYRFYKLRAYVPLLKIEAHEKKDQATIDLIEKASDLIKKSQEQFMFRTSPVSLLDAYNQYLTALSERNNYSVVELITEAKATFFGYAEKNDLLKLNEEYTVKDLIADNSAFSYADASKENLIKVIDYMLKHSDENGIELKLKKKDYKE